MFKPIFKKIREIYPNEKMIPLHAPCFDEEEEHLVQDCIRSTFVSTVGEYVSQFERDLANYTGAKHCVVVQTGTAALQLSLLSVGVMSGDEVITQSLSFIATANAISHCGAHPVFLDVESQRPTLCPVQLEEYLKEVAEVDDQGRAFNKITKRKISAIIPMHTLGFSSQTDELVRIASQYNIPVVEDAAEALGSFQNNKHLGLCGSVGVFSFNGNKIITSGGGGAIITNDSQIANLTKHLSTTGKIPHPYEFRHDLVAFNYRLPNLNAALGVAQLRKITKFVEKKREIASEYQDFFDSISIPVLKDCVSEKSNYWLNAVMLDDQSQRDEFLNSARENQIQCRPFWHPIHLQAPYSESEAFGALPNTDLFYSRTVKIPSSVSGSR